MKRIPLSRAYQLLQDCSAVQVDKNLTVLVPSLMGTENPDGEFMHLSWTEVDSDDQSGYTYEYYFHKDDNELVTIKNCAMTLISTEDEKVELTLLIDWNAEEWIKAFTE